MPNIEELIEQVLASTLSVSGSYRHFDKYASADRPILGDGRLLKWYDVYSKDKPIPSEIKSTARLTIESGQLDIRGLGFVILHRCGLNFYFLIANSWRNENELWEAVWYKDGDSMRSFAEFTRDRSQKPTFCLWELVPVAYERDCWKQFLQSARRESDVKDWLSCQYSGNA